jgi:asparagine synthase (glutamine-hydrolysing)
MCGILAWYQRDQQINNDLFHQMLQTLHHRGPDSEGVSTYQNGHLALGHKRLAFLDLSASGSQPMQSGSGRYAIVLNGEIYNYLELKEQLSTTYEFQTETDTEVVLAAFEKWGIASLDYLKGMFAMVVYDYHSQAMYLIRDRFGIKPLYYLIDDEQLVVASELKPIVASGTKLTLNRAAFIDYFVYRYIPSPYSIWNEVSKLEPAHYLKVDLTDLSAIKVQYWHLEEGSRKNQQAKIETLLSASVHTHLHADVTVGAFLSGGYDSSALVALAKQQNKEIPTFSIGFEGWQKSEDHFAKIVADHLQLKNESVVVDYNDLKLLDQMPDVYDEPIADISILPTFIVSRLAASQVKAVIGGEGADEIFMGYTWQKSWQIFQKKRKYWFSEPTKDELVDFYADAMSMGCFDEFELKQMLTDEWHGSIKNDINWFYRNSVQTNFSSQRKIQYLDLRTFMSELVLTKIDRASMANSLEVRVPFLDHELVETVFSQRKKDNFTPHITKLNLFQIIKDKLPLEILKREKQGFVGPDDYYMDINFYKKELAKANLVKDGIIKQAYLDQLLNETYNWRLWKILVMEKWYSRWMVNEQTING